MAVDVHDIDDAVGVVRFEVGGYDVDGDAAVAVPEEDRMHAGIAVEQRGGGVREPQLLARVYLLRAIHQRSCDHRYSLRASILERALEAVDHAANACRV